MRIGRASASTGDVRRRPDGRARGIVATTAAWAVPLVLACGPPADRSSAAAEAGDDVPASAAAAGMGAGAPVARGRAPAASGGLPSVVVLTPASSDERDAGAGRSQEAPDRDAASRGGPAPDHPSAPARGEGAVIDQFGLAFSPRVLVAAAGEPVRFTNSEGAITHNVHVRSIAGDSTVFNGDTGPTEGVDVELPGPGGYDVLCDMHPGMTAFVFATEAPWAVAADTDGTFSLGPVPPGDYLARVWTVEAGLGEGRPVTIGDGPTDLDLTEPR